MKVSAEEARRIAVRAQLLDGTAGGVLETVRRPGFLQLDVVQPVAEPRFDRKTAALELLGAWGDTSRVDEALDDLAAWLGAGTISR